MASNLNTRQRAVKKMIFHLTTKVGQKWSISVYHSAVTLCVCCPAPPTDLWNKLWGDQLLIPEPLQAQAEQTEAWHHFEISSPVCVCERVWHTKPGELIPHKSRAIRQREKTIWPQLGRWFREGSRHRKQTSSSEELKLAFFNTSKHFDSIWSYNTYHDTGEMIRCIVVYCHTVGKQTIYLLLS